MLPNSLGVAFFDENWRNVRSDGGSGDIFLEPRTKASGRRIGFRSAGGDYSICEMAAKRCVLVGFHTHLPTLSIGYVRPGIDGPFIPESAPSSPSGQGRHPCTSAASDVGTWSRSILTSTKLPHDEKRETGIDPDSLCLLRWCRRRDLNPHGFPHHPLKMACLPIPPLRRTSGKNNIIQPRLENQVGDFGPCFPLQTAGGIVV